MATTATYTGYQFSTNKDIIKYEMEIELREMDCFAKLCGSYIYKSQKSNFLDWINQVNLNRYKLEVLGFLAKDHRGKI